MVMILRFFCRFLRVKFEFFLTLNNTLKKKEDFLVNKFAFLKALCYNDKREYFASLFLTK